MLAIFKREFKSFFQNVIGWVFIASMVFVAAMYFRVYNLSGGYPDIRYILMNLLIIMVFAIPVLVMRSFPEERKNKIDQLTLTSPISIGKLVAGKYFAMVAVFGITTLVIGSFMLLIAGYTTIDWPLNGLAILGFFLYGCASIAVCVFVSALTESQVLSAIISIILSFVIYMISGIEYLFNVTEKKILIAFAKALDVMNYSSRFDAFLNGVCDLKAIIYFVTVCFVFLFFTTQIIQKRRFSTSVKNISLQAFSVSMILIVIAVAIGGNFALTKLPVKYTEADLTMQKLYTLTDATKELVANVDEPITIYVYVSEDGKDVTVDKILQKYAGLNKNISIVYMDPAKAIKFYEKFTSEEPVLNSLFMESASKTRYISANDLYVSDYSYNETTGQYDTVNAYDIEGQITSGISYMLYGANLKIYSITGHDEIPLEEGYLDAIKKANYEVEDLSLLGNEIPQDCQVILINAPVSDYSSEDANKIIGFLDNGGTVIITIEVVEDISKNMPNFDKILKYFKTSVENGLVVDMNAYAQNPFFIIPDVNHVPETNGIYGKKNVWMPYAKAITVDESAEDVLSTTILKSSGNSYKKIDIENAKSFDKASEDEDGPFNVAVTVTKEGKGKAYIVGSPYLFSDTADQATSNAGSTLFMNMINSSVTEAETMTAVVPVRTMDSDPFIIDSMAGLIIFLFVLFVLPLVLIITGMVIWLIRRRK